MRTFLFLTIVILTSLSSFASPPMCSETSGNAALVVIDMQPFFAERARRHNDPENKAKLNKVIAEQKKAIEQAREAGVPIIFIEYEVQPYDLGKTSESLMTAASGHRDVQVIKKTTDGMFDPGNKHIKALEAFIKKHQIGTLVITGANGGACVEQSITGALVNNCNVVAVSTAIADFNYRDFIYPYSGQYSSMEKVAKKHCSNCTFKEVSSVDVASNSMINKNSGAPANTKSESATGTR